VAEHVLPAYVDGLLAHWRESAEDAGEKDLIRRLDAGEDVSAEEIAHDRLLWGAPEDVIGQITRYRELTGSEHVHAAFGAGLPAGDSSVSTRGSYDELAEMIRLFGREVIPAFR
ncbi:F420-dependent oxidoreductase, partial [Streptomyces sp. SID3343]|nr:F420-dependent oxidoreductase [Streptomyces sp. SID3343]